MAVEVVTDPGDPRVRDFRDLTDVAARAVREPAEGLFVAEGAMVIRRAVAAGYRPLTLLSAPRWADGLAPELADAGAAVVIADEDVLRGITGYRVHRGALATFARRSLPPPEQLVTGARLVVVLVDLVDHTNVGAVFRNAAALGADAVLASPACADPLYRRSVKVSMGAVLGLPWTRTGADPVADLAGFTLLALTPAPDAVDIGALDLAGRPRALMVGTEGPGLPTSLLARADLRVRIPMAAGVDSLNVAAATAIALYAFGRR